MFIQRKKTYSEIVGKNIQTINATVTLPDGVEELPMGTLLITVDGGRTFSVADADSAPDGVLTDYLKATEVTSVLITGSIIERNLPEEPSLEQRVALFENKIILV